MAILAFQKPENVLITESSDVFGRFEFRPLEPGYGITIGNALRRILLSSLEGYAVTSILIEGIHHEFATIPGVLEDVTNIILNIKQIRFKQLVAGADKETIRLSISNKEQLKAGDLNKVLSFFEVLNPNFVICHMDKSASINITFNISKGRGYVPADENRLAVLEEATKQDSENVDLIAIDSIYTPIRNVKYIVENYRVEQKTDYEKLTIEVTTDGSIQPKVAMQEAASILISHFNLFAADDYAIDNQSEDDVDIDPSMMRIRQLLTTKIVELDLSVRCLNALKSSGVETLGDLVRYSKDDLLKFRNFGKKSLGELDELYERLGVEYGMDISKYKLD